MGLGFWYPLSEMPEQGLCSFPTREDAEGFIDLICENAEDLAKEEFQIEPYDAQLCFTLRMSAGLKPGLQHQAAN